VSPLQQQQRSSAGSRIVAAHKSSSGRTLGAGLTGWTKGRGLEGAEAVTERWLETVGDGAWRVLHALCMRQLLPCPQCCCGAW
jgi:hypothetical protein